MINKIRNKIKRKRFIELRRINFNVSHYNAKQRGFKRMIKRTLTDVDGKILNARVKFYPIEEEEVLNYFQNLRILKGGLKKNEKRTTARF